MLAMGDVEKLFAAHFGPLQQAIDQANNKIDLLFEAQKSLQRQVETSMARAAMELSVMKDAINLGVQREQPASDNSTEDAPEESTLDLEGDQESFELSWDSTGASGHGEKDLDSVRRIVLEDKLLPWPDDQHKEITFCKKYGLARGSNRGMECILCPKGQHVVKWHREQMRKHMRYAHWAELERFAQEAEGEMEGFLLSGILVERKASHKVTKSLKEAELLFPKGLGIQPVQLHGEKLLLLLRPSVLPFHAQDKLHGHIQFDEEVVASILCHVDHQVRQEREEAEALVTDGGLSEITTGPEDSREEESWTWPRWWEVPGKEKEDAEEGRCWEDPWGGWKSESAVRWQRRKDSWRSEEDSTPANDWEESSSKPSASVVAKEPQVALYTATADFDPTDYGEEYLTLRKGESLLVLEDCMMDGWAFAYAVPPDFELGMPASMYLSGWFPPKYAKLRGVTE